MKRERIVFLNDYHSKKLVVDEHGAPVEVIIAWSDYKDLAERLGWDLADEDVEDLRQAREDWQKADKKAFVPLSELK